MQPVHEFLINLVFLQERLPPVIAWLTHSQSRPANAGPGFARKLPKPRLQR